MLIVQYGRLEAHQRALCWLPILGTENILSMPRCMCGTRDHLDAFPQSIVNNSCTIFRRMAQAVCIVYTLVIHLMLLH